jgi:hypothetical protein
MSDDLARIPSPFDKPPVSRRRRHSPNGVNEKAIILERPNATIVGSGRVFLDDRNAVSDALVDEIRHKAFLLSSTFLLEAQYGMREEVKLLGQVGFIRKNALPDSPDTKRRRTDGDECNVRMYKRYAVEPVTARHNIKNQMLESERSGERLAAEFDHAKYTSLEDNAVERLGFPDGGSTPVDHVVVRREDATSDSIVWDSIDTTKGSEIGSVSSPHELTKSIRSFPRARDYTLAAGHKIGIAVYRFWDIPMVDAQFTGTEPEWEKKGPALFGEKCRPAIYTGEIVHVSEQDGKSFVHNINSFKGCSGAIIFLLDQNQPDSIAQETSPGGSLYGAAIAVHVGSPANDLRNSNVNVGFVLPE